MRSVINDPCERQKSDRRIFDLVTKCYVELQECQPLVARCYDEFQPTRKRTVEVIHYLADVMLATRRVLKMEEQLEQWHQLIYSEPVEPKTAAHIITRCAGIYKMRGLVPADYFRHIRRKSGERVESAAA